MTNDSVQRYSLTFVGYNLKVLEIFNVQAKFRSKYVGAFAASFVPNFTMQLKQKPKEKFRMAAILLHMTQKYVLPQLKAHTLPRCVHT